jgi:PKD repeat protein
MQSNGLMFAADDFGNTIATAAALTPTQVNGMNSYDIKGVIETPSDVDMFKFASEAGTITINAQPFERSPNLDILLQLRDAAGKVIAQANPINALNASITVTVPAAGTYYLSVEGTGQGDPLTTGYSAYGSIGRYSVSLTAPIAGGVPTAVINASTRSGPAPLMVNFSGTGSTDPSGSISSYVWNFGDGSPTVSGQTATHTYNAGGTYSASLKVTNARGFANTSSVGISATTVQPKMFADSIAMSQSWATSQQSYAIAKVTVKDTTGRVIPNATVSGNWSGMVSGATSAAANSSGVATLNSPASSVSGTFKFTISGITAAGYTYDATLNKMTTNSVSR